MITIYDIAKQAGVSAATVSRVLNGYPDVSPKTRAKVQKITSDLGYQPSAVARGLVTKRSNAIGIFFQDHLNTGFRHPFLQDVLASFKDVVGAEGYDLIFFTNHNPENGLESFEARARHRNVDGILLLGVPRTDPNLISLKQSRIPCMSIDLDLLGPRAGYVCSDNIQGSIKAIEFLVQMNHREIAFISDVFDTKPGHDRLMGYQMGLQQFQLPFHPEWILNGDFSEEGGYKSTLHLLRTGDLPTAIFCAGDMMAIGAIRAIQENQLVVGRDISIIGFDDVGILKYVNPKLTTIRQKKEVMGQKAAAELLQLIADPNYMPLAVTIETELVVRETVIRRE